MKYFIGIVLCVSMVCAEAIPEASVKYFQLSEYRAFVEVVEAPKGNPLSKKDDSEVTVTPVIVVTTETVEGRPPVKEAEPPQPKLEAQKPTDTPSTQKSDEVKPPIVSESSPPSKQTVPSASSMAPSKVIPEPKVLSAEVASAQARAKKMYDKEAGYVGVTDRIMTAQSGQRFLYINIKGDGNCGFYASGVSRPVFVQTIEDLINAQHEVYQAVVNERDALVNNVENIMLRDDKRGLIDRVRRLIIQADNGNSLILTLERLEDYEAEKAKYRAELFQDWRRDLIARLQELTDISAVQGNSGLIDHIHTLINGLASANYDDADIRKLIEDNGKEIIVELQRMNVSSERFQRDMKGILDILSCSDELLFEKFKFRLINQIQNLTTLASYEAFLQALQRELIASGVAEQDLVSKADVLAGVEKNFL
jgi:hypothetical protein